MYLSLGGSFSFGSLNVVLSGKMGSWLLLVCTGRLLACLKRRRGGSDERWAREEDLAAALTQVKHRADGSGTARLPGHWLEKKSSRTGPIEGWFSAGGVVQRWRGGFKI
jgi:hypothetical protein